MTRLLIKASVLKNMPRALLFQSGKLVSFNKIFFARVSNWLEKYLINSLIIKQKIKRTREAIVDKVSLFDIMHLSERHRKHINKKLKP